jgi:hypothetical protein
MLRLIAAGFLAVVHASGALAQAGPWVAKRTDFGLTAVGEADIKPGAPHTTWNILAVGLFCGSAKAKPRPIHIYVYGLGADRLDGNRPVEATFTAGNQATNVTLRPENDVAHGPVDAAFVRSLMKTRDASVSIKDYNSPKPDRIKMDGAAAAIRTALKACLK